MGSITSSVGIRPRASAIQVRSIRMTAGRLVCDVRISDKRCRFVTDDVLRRALERFPMLPRHACVNNRGKTFGCVMGSTSIPHLMEHVIIDLQARDEKDGAAVFVGTTEWLDDSAGLARIQVSFMDDLAALRALDQALSFFAECLASAS